MIAGIMLMVGGVLLAAAVAAWALTTWWRQRAAVRAARRAALAPRTVTVTLREEYLPVIRREGSPFGELPPIVPGRDTPAVHLTATPPAVVPAAVTQFPAGGSSLVPGAGVVESPVTTATCPRDDTSPKVDSPVPEDSRAGERQGPGPDCLPEGNAPGSRSPQEAPGPGALPPEVTGPLDALREVVAELARPTDEQQFPDLMPAWEDDTGSFAAFVEDGA